MKRRMEISNQMQEPNQIVRPQNLILIRRHVLTQSNNLRGRIRCRSSQYSRMIGREE